MSSYPTRIAAILALEEAIEAYRGYTGPGPGKWTVDSPGKYFIALTWYGQFKHLQPDFNGERPWREFGGHEILRTAGLQSSRYLTGDSGYGVFSSALILVQG